MDTRLGPINFSSDQIQEIVTRIISCNPAIELESDLIDLQMNFREHFGVDSLVLAEITIELEDEFDIRFPDSVFSQLKTVSDAIDAVENNLRLNVKKL